MLVCVIGWGTASSAETFKVAVPQLAPASTEAYKALITAIIEATGNSAEVQVLPFARCLYLVESKEVDIVSAIIALPDQKKVANLKYDYSSAYSVEVVFVLYSNKAKKIDAAELRKGNPKGYRIETDAAHTEYFNFPIGASTNLDGSLKKVDSGDIDGYIFAQTTGDTAIKRLGLANVARQYFQTYTGVFPIQKGARGGKTDKMITEGLAKIKANGKYQQIMAANLAAAVYKE